MDEKSEKKDRLSIEEKVAGLAALAADALGKAVESGEKTVVVVVPTVVITKCVFDRQWGDD